MDKIPFSYGKIPDDSNFTNRSNEIRYLNNNFKGLVNTILISPRRWGKSTLVTHAASLTKEEANDIKIVHLDIFNIRNEQEFYHTLANEVLKSTANGWEEFVNNAKKFLVKLVPKISFSPDNQTELSFGIGWQELQQQPDEILDLAETIATEKKFRMIVCIDEFQNLSLFNDPLAFQRKLRAHWQRHQKVAYCLYGSKRHMLTDIFTNPGMPFYKFGDILFLKKIAREEWIPFIIRRFTDTGKEIRKEDAALICQLVDDHPYYVQQLSQQSWFRTTKLCTKDIVNSAFEAIVDQLSLLFANITEGLNAKQLGLLHAITNGEEKFSAQKTLKQYRLGTSANVIKLKDSLIQNEIIDDMEGKLTFLDPMYQHWLSNCFFK